MALRVWMWLVACAIVLVGSVLLVGCPQQQPPETIISRPSAEHPTEAVQQPTAEEAGAAEPTVSPSEFEWTQSPTVDQIPAGPITGMLHGRPFAARTVRIEKSDEDTWRMQISNGELSDPDKITSMISKDDAWRCRFTIPEGSTGTIQRAIEDEKTFDDEHAYYYYFQGDDKPPMSVNGPWGMALQITEWTVGPSSTDSKVIGSMKGRIALVMRDTHDSWAAGHFEGPVYQW